MAHTTDTITFPAPPEADSRSIPRGFSAGAAAAARRVSSPFAAGFLAALSESVAADASSQQRAVALQNQQLQNTLLGFKIEAAQRTAALGDPETTAAFDIPGPLAETLARQGLTLSANLDGKRMVRTPGSPTGVPLSPSVARDFRAAADQTRNVAVNSTLHGVLIQDLADSNLLADTDDEEENARASAALRAAGKYLSPQEASVLYNRIRTARLGGQSMAEIRANLSPIYGQAREVRENTLRDARRVSQQRLGHLNTLTARDVVAFPEMLMGAEALMTKPLVNITDAELASFRGKADDSTLDLLIDQRNSLRREQTLIMRSGRVNALKSTITRPLSGPGSVLDADTGTNPDSGFGATIIELVKLTPAGQTDDLAAFMAAAQAQARDALWDDFPEEYIDALIGRDPDLQHLLTAGPPAPAPGSLVLPDGTVVIAEELDERAGDLGMTPVELRRQLRERGAIDAGVANASTQ